MISHEANVCRRSCRVKSLMSGSSEDLVETPPARFMGRFESLRTEPSEVAVTSRSIVEGIDVVSHFGDRELSVFVDLLLDSLLLEAAEEGLGYGVSQQLPFRLGEE
jgi:hypothetical protein